MSGATSEAQVYDIAQILNALPHRYPLLLVDRVKSLKVDEEIHAVKAVSFNEQFFQGHFPGRPIMPGVLQIEALAQAAALLTFIEEQPKDPGKSLYYFVGIAVARFMLVVEPGDQLILEIELDRIKGGIYKFKGCARVGDSMACEAEIMCTMRTVA